MELKTVFPNLTVMWSRWSEYTVVEDRGGAQYLVPSPNAVELTYNCAEHPKTLVAEALDLGRKLWMAGTDETRLCAGFAARNGLLGLEAEKGTCYADDPELPPFCRPLNTRDYGEDINLFQEEFMILYQHFQTTRGAISVSPQYSRVMDLSRLLNYRLTCGRTPQLVWEMRSMLSVIRLFYASMVTGDAVPLRVCKNCGKVYYNSHAKSEFCSARCRNYYNVKAFRSKEKTDHYKQDEGGQGG